MLDIRRLASAGASLWQRAQLAKERARQWRPAERRLRNNDPVRSRAVSDYRWKLICCRWVRPGSHCWWREQTNFKVTERGGGEVFFARHRSAFLAGETGAKLAKRLIVQLERQTSPKTHSSVMRFGEQVQSRNSAASRNEQEALESLARESLRKRKGLHY